MRVWIKRIGVICLIPIAGVLLLSILLYIPPFQNFAVRKATEYAGKATGMQIGVEQIRLSFPLDLTVKGVEVVNPPADTLLSLQSLMVRVHALSLLRKQVWVEAIDLQNVKVHTGTMIEGMEIKGFLGKLHLHADRIDLSEEKATLNIVDLSDTAITLLLNDSTSKEDTTSSPLNWILKLDKIRLERVAFALQMPSDSLRLTAFVNKAGLNNGLADLGAELYQAGNFDLTNSTFAYDGNYAAPEQGLDFSHIRLTNLNTAIDSIRYHGKEMNARIKAFSAEERSGLKVSALTGNVRSDSEQIDLPDLLLQTPNSEARLTATIPWSSFEDHPLGSLKARLSASLGKEDLLIAADPLPEDFKQAYPDKSLVITAGVEGNLSGMRITQGDIVLPGAFQMNVTGSIESVTDRIRRTGDVQFEGRSGNLDFLLALLPASRRDPFALPAGIQWKGEAMVANQEYRAELLLTQDKGKVDLTARYDPVKQAYEAHLRIDSLEPTHFMPKDSLFWLTASVKAEGRGTDPFAERTWAKLEGTISDIRYGASSVSDISIEGSLEKNLLQVDLLSEYPLAKMEVSLNATLRKREVKAMLIADVENADLRGMHLMEDPFATSFQLFAEAESDLEENHRIDLTLGNWEVVTSKQRFKPKTLTLHARTDADTTRVSFHAGDLGIILTGNDCIHHIADQLTKVSDDIALQLERDSSVNLEILRQLLPDMYLEVRAGQDNPIYNYLQTYYVDFKSIAMNAYTSPETGIRMDAFVYELARDTTRIDTLRAEMRQDSLGLRYHAQAIKNAYRRQPPFSAGLEGQIRPGFGDARLYFKDGKGKTGLSLGIRADKIPDGVKFHLFPDDPILAFRPFKLNPDNYVAVRGLKDIEANLRLSGENNAALWIHSQAGSDGRKEVHAELNQIDLGIISNASGYLPPMKGLLNADFQYAPSDSAFLVVADINADDLYYENERVGELMFNAVYLPLERGNHQMDMHLFRDRKEVSAITAFYRAGETDSISGTIEFMHFPLDIANPFIPDDMAKMGGDLDGTLAISGQSDTPLAEGYLVLDSASVYVGAVGSTFRFDDKKIAIKQNRILFDQYGIYAYNKQPFIINGTVDFNDLSRMTADLKLTANHSQLLNARKNEESLVYGKLFVNLNATARGPLDALTTRGDLQLLGGTNITYVLKDSPLTVQDRMSDLVTFTSFSDTLRRRMPRKPPLPVGGMDLLMTIRIDPAVQANVDLSPDPSNHIRLEGGGDLSFQYTPQGDMLLSGRYTLSGGTVKYAIPVIPLKEFNVQEGSYVEWTGDPMDPILHLTATERVRTSVTLTGQSSPRPVNFDVGIELTQRLENLGLQFTLTAPEDLAMQEELTLKGPEERAKLAVSMLVTGMYLGGGGDGKVNVNMGDALTNFLQSEINNIAGSALKSVDISFGMETYDDNGDAGGGTRTDYSFRFAKRFYNDRIRVVLGGRISTGENINNGQAQPFIDNVSVEYRLDSSGSRYVKLFHDKNYESLLEGEITETGAGIVLRKKMMRLRELFNFKKTKVKPINDEKETE
ncbi:translocation/assembly module TamB domain-containing protein [Parabacteroides sp. ZJ-118]|uniref:translocation/assembly module TamB domain-containing protein n=1 Tax=Parabacteroides sp. ZJ-118 TaxID=2709398 RepID=UPI0013EA498E|nr:translocation/assembly module TamB domain-containing protein [Parabacteroides sp. ZJ-118]